MRLNLLLAGTLLANVLGATNHYVDSAVPSSGSGLTWATAWKSVSNITGLAAGDTVYFSGGASAGSQTYSMSTHWSPVGGTRGNPITYAVGQDSSHNGLVKFDGGGTADYWLAPSSWVTINGNDGNGNQHMTTQNFALTQEWVQASNTQGVVLLYIVLAPGDGINFTTANYFEVGHVNIHATYDHAVNASAPPAPIGYGVNKVHDCVFLDDHEPGTGFGTDAIQWSNSIDIYNNVFQGNDVNGWNNSGSHQHQDGYQSDGQYSRVYNNTFINIGGYPVFFNYYGNVADFYVFNNIAVINSTEYAGGGQQFANMTFYGSPGSYTAQRIGFINNTVMNYTGAPGINITSNTSVTVLSTVVAENNLLWNVSGGIQTAPGVTVANNYGQAGTAPIAGNSIFINWQDPTSIPFSYNPGLLSTAAVVIGQGANLTSLGMTQLNSDAAGVARPASGAWDIGAYQQGGVSQPLPPPTGFLSPPTGLVVLVQ